MTRICRWIAPLLLVVAICLPRLHAQGGQGRQDPNQENEKLEHVPALQYTLAILFTMLVLTIVCMPSRKAFTD